MYLFFELLFLVVFSLESVWLIQQSHAQLYRKNDGSRIIGGSDAAEGQFPFMVAINVQTSNSLFFCGGALISHLYILTAGHCVDGATLFSINLGSTTLDGDDSNRVPVTTSEYVIHPDYNSETLESDIGVIRLEMSIRYTDYIKAIYLPYKFIDGGQDVTALGWGQTNDTDQEYSKNLQFVTVTTMIQEFCEDIYGEGVIKETMICISGNDNEGTCVGDSGGPLIQYNNASNTVWHVGVSSFLSKNGCESTDPSGFTRTFPFREWLRNVTNV